MLASRHEVVIMYALSPKRIMPILQQVCSLLLVLLLPPTSAADLLPSLDESENAATGGTKGGDVSSIFNLLQRDHGSSIFDATGRGLQSASCNDVIDTYPVNTVKQILTSTFDRFVQLGISEYSSILSDVVPSLEHDVQLIKVCGSCESEGLDGYGCEKNDYGYDTTHSGLLLLPVNMDEESNSVSIIDTKELSTWMSFRASMLAQIDSANQVYRIGFGVVEYQLMAASMGLVSISPEKMGYGESFGLVPSALDKRGMITALLPLLEKARSIVHEKSDGMTTIGNKAYFMGFSEGGWSSIAAADGLEKHGIEPVKVLAAGAPIKARSTLILGAFQSLIEGKLNIFFILTIGIISIFLSDTRPGVANYGSGQSVLEPALVDDLLNLYTDLTAPSILMSSDPAADYLFGFLAPNYPSIVQAETIFSSNFFLFYSAANEAGVEDPCLTDPQSATDFEVDLVCKALDENDLTNVVLNAPYDIELCHGNADELVVIENVPDESFLKYTVEGANHIMSQLPCLGKLFYGASSTIEKPIIGNGGTDTKGPKKGKTAEAPKKGKTTKAPKKEKTTKVQKEYKKGKKTTRA